MSNNETFGMSVEKAICEIYELSNDIDKKRVNKQIIEEIRPILTIYLTEQKNTN
jgi:hypothetical protein